METIDCPICGSQQSTLVLAGPDLLHSSDQIFRMVQCVRCEHYYQNPRPTRAMIGTHYPADYMPFQLAIEDEPRWWTRFSRGYGRTRRCRAVHEAAGGKPGQLLDVGCATGIFLDGMRQLGWDVKGIEPSAHAAAYARDRFQLSVFEGGIEEAPYDDATFDVITLWDVLEHLHDPLAALDQLRRWLRPGGLLVISIPNPDSLEARLFKSYWIGWDLPRHLNLFRPARLREILARTRFDTLKIESFTSGYTVLLMCLEAILNERGYNGARFRRFFSLWPFRLVSKLYYHGPAKWFNWSSIMVVFARRSIEDGSSRA